MHMQAHTLKHKKIGVPGFQITTYCHTIQIGLILDISMCSLILMYNRQNLYIWTLEYRNLIKCTSVKNIPLTYTEPIKANIDHVTYSLFYK